MTESQGLKTENRKPVIECPYGITNATDMNYGKLQEMVRDREAWCATIHEVAKSLTRLGD